MPRQFTDEPLPQALAQPDPPRRTQARTQVRTQSRWLTDAEIRHEAARIVAWVSCRPADQSDDVLARSRELPREEEDRVIAAVRAVLGVNCDDGDDGNA